MTARRDYDIAISGGGMVGAALACALARNMPQRSIAVIERAEPSAAPPVFDTRGIALSLSSRRFFSEIGLWSELEPASLPVRRIEVAMSPRRAAVTLDCRDIGEEALCHMVENRTLGEALMRRVAESANVDWLAPCVARQPRFEADAACLEVVSATSQTGAGAGREIAAQLLIVAEGAQSKLAQALGIATRRVDEMQSAAMTATLAPAPGTRSADVACQIFRGEDILAVLPLPADADGGERAKLVWSTGEERAKALQEMPEEEFFDELKAATAPLAGSFVRVGERSVYPLTHSIALEQQRRRVLLLGNAAMSLHPVAAQGFNLALRDVAALSQLLAGASGDLGDLQLLQRFSSQRSGDRRATELFSRWLPQLLATQSQRGRRLRAAGLGALARLYPLRAQFTRAATGLGGDRWFSQAP